MVAELLSPTSDILSTSLMKKFHFLDNWNNGLHEFDTIREAKREARRHTCGFTLYIYDDTGKQVATVPPAERPFP